MQLDPAWIALIGTLCGGIGLKVLEHWLGKSKVRADEAAKLRDELRIELNSQKDEIRELELKLQEVTREYYDLRDKYMELNTKYMIAIEKVKDETERARTLVQEVDSPPDI